MYIGCASFLLIYIYIYIGQPQECMKDCIAIIEKFSNGTQGYVKNCLIYDDQIEIYIVMSSDF